MEFSLPCEQKNYQTNGKTWMREQKQKRNNLVEKKIMPSVKNL